MPISQVPISTPMMLPQHPTRRPSSRVPSDVHDLGVGNVDVHPPSRTNTFPKVNVLEVHEVPLIEPADGVESLTPHQKTGPGQPPGSPLDRFHLLPISTSPGIGLPHSPENGMPNPTPKRGQQPGRRVDLTRGFPDQRPEHPTPRPPLSSRDQRIHAAGSELDVRIGNQHPPHIGSKRGNPAIGPAAIPEVSPGGQKCHMIPRGGNLLGNPVGGPVVGQDHLHRTGSSLRKGVHKGSQRLARRVRDRHDTKSVAVVHARHPSAARSATDAPTERQRRRRTNAARS
ncbi:hypothetical protein SAMN04488564_103333 [Lentzea waywayandensis]|uniref:Uncharacterized protein n=1 Tax=Lentzea waywayandensis TaxID=84724 RepID=A0A1I6DXW3_9PSEU|nr:hypothetical protein SAMN04488564_103333 [Lentzea waywayandensis]